MRRPAERREIFGDAQCAQMTAALVQQNNVTATKVGSGTVSTSDGRLGCGSKCVPVYDAGAVVAINAVSSSNSVFTRWGRSSDWSGQIRHARATMASALVKADRQGEPCGHWHDG